MTSRTAHEISNTPTAPHPARESASVDGTFASSSNWNTLYAPPARESSASATWRTHKRTFIGKAPLLSGLRAQGFDAELPCVLGVQSRPAAELHGLGAAMRPMG